VRGQADAVHRGRAPSAKDADYPQPAGRGGGVAPSSTPAIAALHSVAMTCAQIAIMPKNSASDASVAASSTRARTMISYSHPTEQVMNIVHAMFQVKCQQAGMLDAPKRMTDMF